MVTRSAVMLAALSTRTSAFCLPASARNGLLNSAARTVAAARSVGTRVSRLLAVETEVETSLGISLEDARDVSNVKSSFLRTLVERGFYHQCTDIEGLDDKLHSGDVVKAYLGFDATADR